MLNFSPEKIREINGSYLFCMDKVAPRICDDWEEMYRLVEELAKRPCESHGVIAFEAAVREPGAERFCGNCLPCQAKKLVEEKDGEHGNNPVHS